MTLRGTLWHVPIPEPPQSALRRLRDAARARFGHLIHEMGKYGVVGSVAFVVDAVVYAILLETYGLETLTAKALTTVASTTVAFLGNRFWTWRHRERSGLTREYSLYFAVNGVGLLIGLLILWVSHYGLGAIWPDVFQNTVADLVAANGVGTVVGTAFRFWSYRRFVFLAPTPTVKSNRPPHPGSDPLAHPGPDPWVIPPQVFQSATDGNPGGEVHPVP